MDKLQKKELQSITLFDKEATRFVDSLEGAWSLIQVALSEDLGGTIIVPKLAAIKIGELIAEFGAGIKVIHGNKRSFEKSHEKLIADEEVNQVLERKDFYLIVPFSVTQEALERYNAKVSSIKSYVSNDLTLLRQQSASKQ